MGRVKDALIHAANVLVSNQHVIHSYLLKTTTTTKNVNSFTAKIRHPMSKLGPSLSARGVQTTFMFSTLGLERMRFHYLRTWAVMQFCCCFSDVYISSDTTDNIPKMHVHSFSRHGISNVNAPTQKHMTFLTLMHSKTQC